MRPLFCLVILLITACLPEEIVRVQADSVGEGITFIRGGGGNSLVVVQGRRALLFDPKMWPWGGEVRSFLRAANAEALYVVDSHLHFDHAGENDRYPSALIFAAPMAIERLTRSSLNPELPRPVAIPSMAVRHRFSLTVGAESIVLIHPEAAHTDGDVYLWMPARRLLATGDLFNAGYYPRTDPDNGGRVLGLLSTLDELAGYDAATIIPGHGPTASRAEIVAQRDFLHSLKAAVMESRRLGQTDAEIVEHLSTPGPEQLSAIFSTRRQLVEGLVREIPRG